MVRCARVSSHGVRRLPTEEGRALGNRRLPWRVRRSLSRDDQAKLAAGFVGLKMAEQFGRRSATVFLEFLGELAGEAEAGLGDFGDGVLQHPDDAVGRFEVDAGAATGGGGGEFLAALSAFDGEEAAEIERDHGEAGTGQGEERGGGSGDDLDGDSGGDGGADEAFAGIADSGESGIGDEGDGFAGGKAVDEFGGAFGFAELVVADHRFTDFKAGEEMAGVAGILGSDEGDFLENADGAGGEVLQVTDGSGDDVEFAGHEGRVGNSYGAGGDGGQDPLRS